MATLENQQLPLSYGVTFAGIPFVTDKGVMPHNEIPIPASAKYVKQQQSCADLLDEINRLIDTKYLQDFSLPGSFPGKNLTGLAIRSTVGPFPNPQVKIGDWYYPPTMCQFSVFRGLATSSQAKAMLDATTGSTYSYGGSNFNFNSSSSYRPFIMRSFPTGVADDEDSDFYTVESNMFMLPPRSLAEHGGGYDGLFLITLVDERYFLPGAHTALHVTYGMTWDQALTQISYDLGIVLNWSAIPSAYGYPEPDSALWVNAENGSMMLDAVAYNLGRVVVRNLDGTYDLLTPAESATRVSANRGSASNVIRVAGGDMINNGLGQALLSGNLSNSRNVIVPSTVSITFPKYVSGDDPVPHYVNSRYANPRPSAWNEDTYGDVYFITIPISLGGSAVTGLTGVGDYIIHDTAKALYSTEALAAYSTPSNYTALTALSLQIAQDYYSYQAGAALDEVYPGTYAWDPEGYHDIIWTYSERSRLAATRVMRTQWNQTVVEMQHSTPTIPGSQYKTKGVGGHSVAQTWKDQYGDNTTSPSTTVNYPMLSTDTIAVFTSVDNFPTNQRWKGLVGSELILFDGTSGGIKGATLTTAASPVNSGSTLTADMYATTDYLSLQNGQATIRAVQGLPGQANFNAASFFPAGTNTADITALFPGKTVAKLDRASAIPNGQGVFLSDFISGSVQFDPYFVTIAQRGIDGTFAIAHSTAETILYNGPNNIYGTNLISYGPGQFVYPATVSSGGITEVSVVPQVQNVQALTNVGATIAGHPTSSGTVFSGQIVTYDSVGIVQTPNQYVWLMERNKAGVVSGSYYNGTFVGYSQAPVSGNIIGNTAPIYVVDAGGGGGISVQDTQYCTTLAQKCSKTDTQISVNSVALFPTSGIGPFIQFATGGYSIQIDNEVMKVKSGVGIGLGNTKILSVVRGQFAAPHDNYAIVSQPNPTIQTTLNQNINNSTTTLLVNGRRNFPVTGRFYITIDSEVMIVTDQSGFGNDTTTWTWTVIRGANNTTKTSHLASSAIVFQKLPDIVENVQSIVFDDTAFVQPGTPAVDSQKVIAVHHEVTQPIRIVSTTPNQSGLYDAFLQKWDNFYMKWRDDVPIWAIDMNRSGT